MKRVVTILLALTACSNSSRVLDSGGNRVGLETNLEKSFRDHDNNRDGFLSRQEFLQLPAGVKFHPSYDDIANSDFDSSDEDRDGKLSKREFVDPRLKTFDCIDADKDGILSNTELDRGVAQCK